MARVDRGPVHRGEGWTRLGPGAVDGRGGGWASPSGTPGHLDKVWGRPGVGLGRQGGKRGSGGTYSRQAYMGVYGEPGPRVT